MLVVSDTSPIRAFDWISRVDILGTVGILILAKESGLITSLAPVLQQLRSELNFFVAGELVKRILKEVGEAP